LVYSFEVLSFSKKVAEMKVEGEISTAKGLRNPFLKNYREVIFEQTLSNFFLLIFILFSSDIIFTYLIEY